MSDPSQTVTIDGKQYALSDLSEEAKAQLGNVRVVDEEIKKLEQKLAISKTARAAYAHALKQELDKMEPAPSQ